MTRSYAVTTPCAPQIINLGLRGLLFQAIFMMHTTKNRRRLDAVSIGQIMPIATRRNLVLKRFWDPRPQRHVRPPAIIVVHELLHDKPNVTLIDRNHVVHAIAAYASDHPFAKCVRRRSPHWRFQPAHAESALQLSSEHRAEIMNQEPVAVIERQETRGIVGSSTRRSGALSRCAARRANVFGEFEFGEFEQLRWKQRGKPAGAAHFRG